MECTHYLEPRSWSTLFRPTSVNEDSKTMPAELLQVEP